MDNEKISELKEFEKQVEAIFGGCRPEPGQAKEFFDQFRLRMLYYRCAMKEVQTKLEVLDEEFSLRFDRNPISGVYSRLKDGKSIFEKMRRKDLPISLENMEEHICDIAGIRVLCPFLDDVYDLERALLERYHCVPLYQRNRFTLDSGRVTRPSAQGVLLADVSDVRYAAYTSDDAAWEKQTGVLF